MSLTSATQSPRPGKPSKKFGPTFPNANFPAEMRRQLWPLCCGASIISGFKDVHKLSEDELVNQINETVNNAVPDFQVFASEEIMPKLTFMTLNKEQMDSAKIRSAVEKAGFVKFAECQPRGRPQGFYMRDESKTFKVVV